MKSGESLSENGHAMEALTEAHSVLRTIVEKGLPYHQCGLFHDQLVDITLLDSKNIVPQETPSYGKALPPLCPDRDWKLGCAHAGEHVDVYKGHQRAINSEARAIILNAIELLKACAPTLLSGTEADRISKRLHQLGFWIAHLDIKMSTRRGEGMEPQFIGEHNDIVSEVFGIAKTVDEKLVQAIELVRKNQAD